jgi:crotonobetainyl-CoA:carnitine CoA-transferase CaiB-like acyl-CoA transferase
VWLALAIVAALAGDRDRTTVRVAMLDVAVALLNEKISAFLTTGEEPTRMGAGTSTTTPHGAFPTADAHIVIGAASDASFRELARVLGPPIDGDERFATQAGRLTHRAELESQIVAALAQHGAEHWVAALDAVGVAVGRVSTLAESLARHSRDSATGLRRVNGTGVRVVAPPVVFNGTPWQPLDCPGEAGRDSDTVLTEIGIDDETLERLRGQGVVA